MVSGRMKMAKSEHTLMSVSERCKNPMLIQPCGKTSGFQAVEIGEQENQRA